MNTANRSDPNPSGLTAVLDTNVYISALNHPKGVPFRIWQQAIRRRYTLLVSPAIMRETARVLREYFEWTEPAIVAQLKLLAKVAQIVTPNITIDVIVEDDSDNRILECAVAGNADLIVSGDHHLRKLKTYQGIGIVRPADFLRTLGM